MALRIGIVGFEPGTHSHGYLTAAEQSAEVQVTAVAYRPGVIKEIPETLAQQISALNVPVYNHGEELLENEELDVLALTTVPDEQVNLVVKGLRCGLHVAADKPLVTEPDDLLRVRKELSARPELRVFMMLTMRGDPTRIAARQLLRDGAIGDLVAGHSRRAYQQRRESRPSWFFDERRSGGPLADGAIHGIDEILWVTGLGCQEVVGYEANQSWPEKSHFFDNGQVLMRLEHNVTAIIEHHRLALGDSYFSLLGTEGKLEQSRGNPLVLLTADGEREITELPPSRNVFTDFVESIVEDRPAIVGTEDVFNAMEAVFAARQATKQGKILPAR